VTSPSPVAAAVRPGESVRLRQVQDPVIPIVADLIRATPDTISLGQGVVHYPPPPQALAAAAAFGDRLSDHHYHPVAGLPELRAALRAKLAAENRLEVGEDQVLLVTAGSNMGFCHCLLAIADPGDEVVMMSPFYFNHEMAATMTNVRPVLAATDAHGQPSLEAIAAAITPRTRAVVTISPNNPAGVVYEPERLRAINALCRERGLYHVSDEAYEYFTYSGHRHLSPGSLPDSAGHTLSLFSFSKGYGMASWRVGYLVAPRALLGALEKIQDTVLICAPVVSQHAALGALEAGPAYCRGFLPEIDRARVLCLERLAQLGDRCAILAASGAFYLLARLRTSMPPMALVERLVREYRVAVIPGSAFGLTAGCYVRIAYGALPPERVAQGIDRLVDGLDVLLPA
jgi:aspartate/methionine/tyrosine aminotransferase